MRCLFQPKTVADQVARLLRLYHNLEKKFFWRFCCAVQHHILHPTSPLLAPPLFLIIISPSPLSSTQTNYSTPTILCAWSMLWHDKAVDTVGLCGGAPPSTRLTAWASSRHHQSGSHPAHPLAVPPHPCRPLRKLRSSHRWCGRAIQRHLPHLGAPRICATHALTTQLTNTKPHNFSM